MDYTWYDDLDASDLENPHRLQNNIAVWEIHRSTKVPFYIHRIAIAARDIAVKIIVISL